MLLVLLCGCSGGPHLTPVEGSVYLGGSPCRVPWSFFIRSTRAVGKLQPSSKKMVPLK